MWWREENRPVLVVQSDAALAPDGSAVGLGVVVRDGAGQLLRWLSRRGPPMTNNAAEYAALCLALEVLGHERPAAIHLYSDSEVVVNQLCGRFRVLSAELKPWHRRACALACRVPLVTFTHIPRARNQLADALATEALLAPLPAPESGAARPPMEAPPHVRPREL